MIICTGLVKHNLALIKPRPSILLGDENGSFYPPPPFQLRCELNNPEAELNAAKEFSESGEASQPTRNLFPRRMGFLATGILLASMATTSHACFSTYGSEGSLQSTQPDWNVMQAQYNSALGEWEATGVAFSADAETYVPQINDIVVYDENDEIALIFVPAPSSGGGTPPPGGGTPPPGGGTPPGGIVNGDSGSGQALFSGSYTKDPSNFLSSCLTPPGEDDDIVDRIRVVGQRINFGVITGWTAIRRWGFGDSGLGIGGGSLPAGTTRDNPRKTPGEAPDCPGDVEMRVARASQQIRTSWPLCTNQHRGRYFEVNFAGGKTGIYRGTLGSDCRWTLNSYEVEAPDC